MSQQELLDYIKPNLEKGFSAELLKAELLKAGWEEAAVNEAFASLGNQKEQIFHQETEPEKKEFLGAEIMKKESDVVMKPSLDVEIAKVQALNSVQKKDGIKEAQVAKKEVFKDKVTESKATEKKLSQKGGNKKLSFVLNAKLKLALIILFSVIVLGAAAFFVYARLEDSPMKVLQKSLLTMEGISSFEYDLEIKGDYQWKNGNFSDIMKDPFILLGSQENEMTESVLSPSKYQATLNLSGHSSAQVNNLDSFLNIGFISDEMKEGEKINIETRFIQDQAYLKISLPSLNNFDSDLLANTWTRTSFGKKEERNISHPLDSGTTYFSEPGIKVAESMPVMDVLEPDLVLPYSGSSDNSVPGNDKITEDVWGIINKLNEGIVKNKPFKVVNTFSGSLASGQKTYHYIIEFDKAALERALVEVPVKKEETEEEIKEVMENIELISGELVVGRDDFFMHNFSLSLKMKEGSYSDNMLQILNLKFDLSLKSFNQPINVAAPEDSVDLEDVMGELFMSFLADSFDSESTGEDDLLPDDDFPEIDMELDSDGDGLTDYEEIYIYETDPYNPDTDGDGYLDGEEVLNGYNPLGEGLLSAHLGIVLNSARVRARDAKRIAGIRQIQTALEMYYNRENTYPQDLEQLTVTDPPLLKLIPSAPVPADGDCGDDNNYVYVFKPGALGDISSSYTLSYCLGAPTANIEAGVNIATPAGFSFNLYENLE